MISVCLFSFLMAAPETVPAPRLEVAPSVVFYSGDALRATVMGGALAVYHFNQTFWLGADFVGGQGKVDRLSGTGLKRNEAYYLADLLGYWNLPALPGITKTESSSSGVSADLYTAAGVGHLWIGSRREPAGIVGGGLLIHLGENFGLRFDLKNLFFVLKNAQGNRFNSDMMLGLGPDWMF